MRMQRKKLDLPADWRKGCRRYYSSRYQKSAQLLDAQGLCLHHRQESLCGTERILPVSLSGRTDPEKSAAYKSRCPNNVLAFNYEGKLVWNISEIVGELNFPFSNGFVATSEFVMNNITKDILECNHEYYVCNTLEGCCFVIDITDKKVVYRKMKK